jgi:opacity protein-like surface antigen
LTQPDNSFIYPDIPRIDPALQFFFVIIGEFVQVPTPNYLKGGGMKAIGKKALIVLLTAMTFGALPGTPGLAAAKDFKNYGMAGIGLNRPTGGLDDAGYDTGLTTWITYGHVLGENLVVEGTADFFFTDQDSSGTTAVAGYYTREDTLGVSALMVTLKGRFPVGPVVLFAGAGVGGYYVSLDSEIETSALGDFDVDDDDSVWGVHVVCGASWDLTRRIFLGGQWLYRWTDDINIDKRVGTVPVQLNGDIDGYAVTFLGGFRL